MTFAYASALSCLVDVADISGFNDSLPSALRAPGAVDHPWHRQALSPLPGQRPPATQLPVGEKSCMGSGRAAQTLPVAAAGLVGGAL